MKHRITKVQNYLLVVDDALDINENDWTLKDQDIRRVSYLGQDNGNRIIAHLPLNGEPPLEDVDLLPPIEEDIYQLAEQLSKEYSVYETAQDDVYQGILVGYRKAREKYKYTEEDLKKAIFYALYHPTEDGIITPTKDSIVRKAIRLASQPDLPVGFELEADHDCCGRYVNCKGCDASAEMINLRPRKITTSEGQTQWVGRYVY